MAISPAVSCVSSTQLLLYYPCHLLSHASCQVRVLCLCHDSYFELGAGGSDKHSAFSAEFYRCILDGPRYLRDFSYVLPLSNQNVQKHLRIQFNSGSQLGEELLLFPHQIQYLQSGYGPIPGCVVIKRNDMPGLLAAQIVAAFDHFINYIAVTYLCPQKPYVLSSQKLFET